MVKVAIATVGRMSGSEVRVAVLGAAGTIAPAIVRDLGESDEVAHMTLLDLDGERARAVAEQHGAGKADAQTADARAVDELARTLAGADVLLNTASYRINLDAMQACLKAGCTYLDLGGLFHVTLRQLERGGEFERQGLLAVLGIGSSPGKTNLMAAHGIARLGADDPIAPADGRLRPPYALQTLLDELTLAPIVICDGQTAEIEPLRDGGPVDFGDPIGEAKTIYTLHSEMATFAESFGCASGSFRLSLKPELLARLKELVGASEEEVATAAREAAPQSGETVSVHLVRIGTESGRTVTVRAKSPPHFGLGGSIVSTAAPAAATVRLLARGSIAATGALPPERCIDPAEMFAELETRGCEFSVA